MFLMGMGQLLLQFGPKYEVGQTLRQLDDCDWMIEVTMVETGEREEYHWTRLSDNPEAH